MHAFKFRDDRDYVRPSRRQTASNRILVADENSVASPSPVHALHATLEAYLEQHNTRDPADPGVKRLRQSRLLVIAILAALCWAVIGAIAWLVIF